MCLILAAYKAHPRYRLIIAANRDEFYERPTAPLGVWSDVPGVIAGRDLRSGGTWMGINAAGRFAAVTNFRDGRSGPATGALSRGMLVADYLAGTVEPDAYLRSLAPDSYDGFNLLIGDGDSLYYASNRNGGQRVLEPGVYGLSNGFLDTAWPKVIAGKQAVTAALALGRDADDLEQALLALLANPTPAEDHDLPDTGVGLELERMLSAAFIESPNYGTRSSSVLLIDNTGHVRFVERQTHPEMAEPVSNRFEFNVNA